MVIDFTLQLPNIPLSQVAEYVNSILGAMTVETQRTAEVPYGVYDNLDWQNTDVPTQIEDATTFGLKTLPGAGPFYFANHEDGNPTMGHINPAQPDN